MTMGYLTRAGRLVLHPRAVQAAITAEVYHRDTVAEYRVYRRFVYRDFVADEGDHILTTKLDHAAFEDRAYVVNLTHGATAIIPWETMAHSVAPAEVKNL